MSIQWIHDATHCHVDSDCFYKKVKGVWNLVDSDGDYRRSASLYNGELNELDLVERQQPKQWSGPQDGLPPVGTVCEIKNERHGRTDKKWITCEIIFSSRHYVIIKSSELVGQDEAVCLPSDLRFRSKDQRETAIREFMDIVGIDCRVTASKAVDAGFKREVV